MYCGGQVVIVHDFYFDDPSLNSAEGNSHSIPI